MALTAVVRGPGEAFDFYTLMPQVLADRHVGLAENEAQFTERVHALLERLRPGCSPGLKDLVAGKAWTEHVQRRVRLEISPAALRLLSELLAAAPDSPAAQELAAAVAAAGKRAGWSEQEPGSQS